MGSDTSVAELTGRQRQVADLLSRGLTNGEIAERLGISLDGAKWHVSELIGKFGVSSRDEVAEAWEAEQRRRRWSWAAALASVGVLKGAAAVAGVALVAAGSIVTVVAFGEDGGDDADAAQAQATAPAGIPLPDPPDAIFSGAEALDVALREADRILGKKLQGDVAAPLTIGDLTLDAVEWLPGITRLQTDDPDRYWDPQDGVARDVWRFQWSAGPVQAAAPELGSGRVEVDILVEDGSTGRSLAALAHFLPANGLVGGGENWRSHERDDQIRRQTTAAGPGRQVAWLNGSRDLGYLELYPNLNGHWCLRTLSAAGRPGGTGSCLPADVDLWQKLHVPLTFSWDPALGYGSAILEITCAPETVLLVVTRSDGEVLEFPVTDPVEEVPVRARFAYLDIGTMPEWFTVESYDAAGNLLGETKLGTAGFTPGAAGP